MIVLDVVIGTTHQKHGFRHIQIGGLGRIDWVEGFDCRYSKTNASTYPT